MSQDWTDFNDAKTQAYPKAEKTFSVDVGAFLVSANRVTFTPTTAIPAFTVGHLLDDDSPMTPPLPQCRRRA